MSTTREPSLQERFRRVDEGKRIPLTKLRELASFCEDLQSHANELETAAGDFEADVEQLADSDVRGEERAEVREHLQQAAASIHKTLEALSHYVEHLVQA